MHEIGAHKVAHLAGFSFNLDTLYMTYCYSDFGNAKFKACSARLAKYFRNNYNILT